MPPKLNTLLAEIRLEFPDFEIVAKEDSRLMKVIDVFLKVITWGKMATYMTKFITTMGTTVYVPKSWQLLPEETRMAVLRHERVHMRQAKKYGRLLFSLLYLFVPLPIGLAYFRMKFEKEAYEETIRAYAEYYGHTSVRDGVFRNQIISHFTSAEYFWMWPFGEQLEDWYNDFVYIRLGKRA